MLSKEPHVRVRDEHIPGKKGALQVPLIGFIGRLDYQKGADLVLGAVPWLMDKDVQLVCLGTGDVSLEVGAQTCNHRSGDPSLEMLLCRGDAA